MQAVTVATFVLTGWIGGTVPADKDPLAAHFPADTAVYVRIDVAALSGTLDQRGLWRDPAQAKALVERFRSLVCLNDGEALGLDPAAARALRSAVKQVSLAWMPRPDGRPTMAAAVRLDGPQTASRLLRTARDKGLLRPIRLGKQPAFRLAFSDSDAVLVQSESTIVYWPNRSRAEAAASGPPRHLATHRAFHEAVAQTGGGPIWAWADLQRCRPWLKGLIPGDSPLGRIVVALGLDRPASVAVGMNESGWTTVRLWLAQDNAVLAGMAKVDDRWGLAAALPPNPRWLGWTRLPPPPAALALLERVLPPLPAATQPSTQPANDWATLLAGVREMALVQLPGPADASVENRTALVLGMRSPEVAQRFVGRLDSAVLTATRQPARRRERAGGVMGQWLSGDGKPVGAYAQQGEVVILAAATRPVAAMSGLARRGRTVAASTQASRRLESMGPVGALVAGPVDGFLGAGKPFASIRRLIRPEFRVTVGVRFHPDGVELRTNLPVPLLVLLAATDTVR